ncbi:Polyol:NADP oxidoreductase [Paraglaciecola mesophila]|uniref:Polyol:NADP oxidoreductase n=1 Tax=Paraglaciecola mesophila TaxID=197222 RepID=A0A857JPD5_9ALTE|nr:mannitol dehydrogenase family protein [Paraglaciecola mesophila]QHJ13010.1 Polyol:NADP oxidoreductase [Paraglaciecola mesophila]
MKLERLKITSLNKINSAVCTPEYGSCDLTSSIVHFGAGNFHRAHQAVYCDTLLNQGETQWGITGVSLRSSSMRDKLAPQDCLYTLAILGEQETDYRVIGSMLNLLVGPEDPEAVIELLADQQTQLVTTTITEKGYYLKDGVIDVECDDISYDLRSISLPKTTYGYLAAGLIKRSSLGDLPITVLCCDNMNGGGECLKEGVRLLLAEHSPETLPWVNANVAFSASMVDRVTPATSDTLKDKVTQALGVVDTAPVATEPFSQWIIEDRFAGARPAFDKAGALFVEDIAPFERVKLRFLNAGHSMLAALGYLAGDRFIHDALRRSSLARFTEQALKNDVMPVTLVPAVIDAETYIAQVFARFRNANLPYAALQVGTDSSQKIQQRWFPSIDAALEQDRDANYLAFAVAAWVHFIHKALVNDDLNDPLKADFVRCSSSGQSSDAKVFLALAGANKFRFFEHADFMASIHQYHCVINDIGVEQAIEQHF